MRSELGAYNTRRTRDCGRVTTRHNKPDTASRAQLATAQPLTLPRLRVLAAALSVSIWSLAATMSIGRFVLQITRIHRLHEAHLHLPSLRVSVLLHLDVHPHLVEYRNLDIFTSRP